MKNDTQRAQIIALPYKLASPEEVGMCDDIGVLSAQLRMHGVELIRLIRAGYLQPDEDVLRNLNEINGLLAEFGKPTLALDFI